MNLKKKYRLTIEDESSLEKRLNFSARFPLLILLIIAFTIIAGAFGVFILASTPLKNYLPGYLKDSERTATEEQHLRLDSLVHVYEVNEAYLSGILKALNPSEENQRVRTERKPVPLNADSLLPASEEERRFMENIRERDKYNISYSSSAAAQTMMFGSVNKSAIITEDSKNSYLADIILPLGAPVSAITEGMVISVASSPRSSGGYEVIIQHPKGFMSKTGRLSNVMVRPGDRVTNGQIIASGTTKAGMKSNHVTLELWHDGNPLIPAQYLNGGMENPK
ncbi:MAG: M23 family metallopeptidase [Muribaculaceae bacterium]|nr:M23 family metallopeptidase [Muribaculaceae bacterium]